VTERTLTERELNRALLDRQSLLQRSRASLPRLVERMGCVQAQYAPSTYVGLWSRLEPLEREGVTRALERRTLVQATLMRGTIHVVSRRDYWPLAVAIREERRAWAQRVQKPDVRALRRAAERLRRLLAGGPRRQREIEAAGLWLPGIGLWTDLVRVPPAGTWEHRRADLFGLAEEWVGPEPELPELDAREQLVRRYLGAFGPARRNEIADEPLRGFAAGHGDALPAENSHLGEVVRPRAPIEVIRVDDALLAALALCSPNEREASGVVICDLFIQ